MDDILVANISLTLFFPGHTHAVSVRAGPDGVEIAFPTVTAFAIVLFVIVIIYYAIKCAKGRCKYT